MSDEDPTELVDEVMGAIDDLSAALGRLAGIARKVGKHAEAVRVEEVQAGLLAVENDLAKALSGLLTP